MPTTNQTAEQQIRHVGFRCRPEEFQAFAEAARADERSISAWIRRVLRDALNPKDRADRKEGAR